MSYTPVTQYRPVHFWLHVRSALGVNEPVALKLHPIAPLALNGPNPSRVDIFMGYSYYGAHGQVKPARTSRIRRSTRVLSLSGAYYFNKYVGGEIVSFTSTTRMAQNDGFYSGYASVRSSAPRCRTSPSSLTGLRLAAFSAARWTEQRQCLLQY